jgi:hypothetical protein
MTVSWQRGLPRRSTNFGKWALGVVLMMIGMLVAGISCLLAGLLAVGFGIPVNEFSFGNTLIVSGTVTACAGLIILSLWVVARELKNVAARLGPGTALDWKGNALQPTAALPHPAAAEGDGAVPNADQAGDVVDASGAPPIPSPAPWLEEAAARDRPRQEAPTPSAAEPPVKPRRNLMFSSTSRRERERAQSRAGDPSATEPRPAAAAPVAEIEEVPPATFDDAWPKSERSRPADSLPQRRAARTPSTFSETPADRQPPAVEDQPPVTVLKSGVVDGMAYSLYSDGSIEAQMPEGMMRFASIDELRTHLDQRP